MCSQTIPLDVYIHICMLAIYVRILVTILQQFTAKQQVN